MLLQAMILDIMGKPERSLQTQEEGSGV